MFSLHRHLEDFGCFTSTGVHCDLFNDSLLDSVLRLTAVGIVCTQLAA